MSTGPLTSAAGVNDSVPFGLTITVPRAGSTVAADTLTGSPSGSRSLASTLMLASGVLIGVEARSLTATGASLTGATLIVTCELLVEVPSETV